jgi:serine/threonine protein kinase/peroxiredoxin
LTAVSGRITEFRGRGCDVLGVSTDPVATHERWLGTPPAQGGLGGVNFPLAGDDDGAACRAYGVYLERQRVALRGLFLIDPNGVLQYQVVHGMTVGRSVEEVLRVLDALQMGGMCPAERRRGEPGLDASRELGPGRVIGPYRVEEELGGGSFGTVFRARDLTLDREVAVKVLRPGSPVPAEALLAEARAAAALSHPNVCAIHAVDSSEGVPMIIMEYVAGRPLSQLLGDGPRPRDQAAALVRQVALGMAAAHARGVVHGDLKPANVLVTPAGAVKIVDFGMARRNDARARADATAAWDPRPDGGISGTPAYMAPEQARGEPATPASDVFSLEVILYELVTGQRAREEGNPLELLHRIDRGDLTRRLDETPAPFGELLRLALATVSAERRITMAQIADLLAPATR